MFSHHEVEAVYDQFGNLIVRTPCIYSPYLSQLIKGRAYLKLENMQKTGSFKERGVLSFLLHHKDQEIRHVVTASAGNHAQAVALHA
ncbi:MAG TPA: pyridoxal-phosphate dependent enzyme, partial [Myxococcota bacterium]|nr:pyridoxal-phosphate dependent enzyme [Myxococcota bacterium]